MSQHTHKGKIAELRDVADFIGPNTAEREHAQRLLREWAGLLEASDFRAITEGIRAEGAACDSQSPPTIEALRKGHQEPDDPDLIFHCNLPAGHDGDHEILIDWPKEE